MLSVFGKPACGGEGPHGLRLAAPEGFLFVACDARVVALAVDHDGQTLGSLPTGDGLDDIDYVAASHLVYAGASIGSLTVGAVDAKGGLSVVATVPTAEGSRNGVAARDGKVYLSHGKAGEIIVVTVPTR